MSDNKPLQALGSEAPPRLSGLHALVRIAQRHGLHLTVDQLIRERRITGDRVSVWQIVECAAAVRLKAQVLKPGWEGLFGLRRALPVIVQLTSGESMVLVQAHSVDDVRRVVVREPTSETDALITLERDAFERVWTGEIVLVKPDFDIAERNQPFGFGMVKSLAFQERGVAVDLMVCALVLSFLSLAPIMFWRVLGEWVVPFKAMNTLIVVALVMTVVVLFETLFGALRRRLVAHLATRIDAALSTMMFERVLNLPIDYFERTPSGVIYYKMGELGRVREFMVGQIFGTLLDAGVLLFFLPVMFYMSPILTAILCAVGVLIFGWIVLMLPAYRRRAMALQDAEADRSAFLRQTVLGIRTVKSLALESRHRLEYDVLTARAAKLRFEESRLGNLIATVTMPLNIFMVNGTYAIGAAIAIAGKDPSFGLQLYAFLLLSQRVAKPLLQISQLIQSYNEAAGAVEMVGSLVNQPPEEGRSGHGVKKLLEGQIEFSKVRFQYPGALQPALRDVTFRVERGTTLGVMGRSGSGKTTITRLLQRLHADYTGLIKIDGVDVREYDVDHLRASLGVVLQENFLFSGSIRDNITAAKPDATDEEVVNAARLAGAEEFIERLPSGYGTYIYEGSPNLSGGQKQRIAIARALITDPKILILDEATSALDAESEAIVNANIERISVGRTVITISHRLSAIVKSDAILVLDAGEVQDIGTHDELLARNPIYAGLWYTQNPHAAPASASRPRLIAQAPDHVA